MTTEEAYRALGLSAPADADAVKRAYRQKALESHPDRYQDARDKAFHGKRFMEAREAYSRLRAEGFPELPAESELAADFGPKLAGRSFAPKEPEEAKTADKLGLQVPWRVESVVAWAVGLPAAIGALIYFVRLLLDAVKGGTQ